MTDKVIPDYTFGNKAYTNNYVLLNDNKYNSGDPVTLQSFLDLFYKQVYLKFFLNVIGYYPLNVEPEGFYINGYFSSPHLYYTDYQYLTDIQTLRTKIKMNQRGFNSSYESISMTGKLNFMATNIDIQWLSDNRTSMVDGSLANLMFMTPMYFGNVGNNGGTPFNELFDDIYNNSVNIFGMPPFIKEKVRKGLNLKTTKVMGEINSPTLQTLPEVEVSAKFFLSDEDYNKFVSNDFFNMHARITPKLPNAKEISDDKVISAKYAFLSLKDIVANMSKVRKVTINMTNLRNNRRGTWTGCGMMRNPRFKNENLINDFIPSPGTELNIGELKTIFRNLYKRLIQNVLSNERELSNIQMLFGRPQDSSMNLSDYINYYNQYYNSNYPNYINRFHYTDNTNHVSYVNHDIKTYTSNTSSTRTDALSLTKDGNGTPRNYSRYVFNQTFFTLPYYNTFCVNNVATSNRNVGNYAIVNEADELNNVLHAFYLYFRKATVTNRTDQDIVNFDNFLRDKTILSFGPCRGRPELF